MIEFKKEKFRSDYVYIKKITQNYIYVYSNREGHVYKTENSIRSTYRNKKVSKIKIHPSVFFSYRKHNSLLEFYNTGRLACISYYENKAINIEIQRVDFTSGKYTDAYKWKSNFESVVDKITDIVPDDKKAYIDGKEIFWLEGEHSRDMTEDGCFKLRSVRYLDLSKMGIQITKSNQESSSYVAPLCDTHIKVKTELGLFNGRTFSDLENLSFDKKREIKIPDANEEKESVAFVNQGIVVAYNPLSGINNNYEVLSPVVSRSGMAVDSGSKSKKETDNIFSLIDRKDNKTYLNLNFMIKSIQIIGEIYGYDETDFLNVHEVITDTGVICLTNIDENSQKNYAINLNKWDCLAWLFKFIYQEKELYNMLDLNKLFKYIINNGIVSSKNIVHVFKEGKAQKDIVMYKPRKINWQKKEKQTLNV